MRLALEDGGDRSYGLVGPRRARSAAPSYLGRNDYFIIDEKIAMTRTNLPARQRLGFIAGMVLRWARLFTFSAGIIYTMPATATELTANTSRQTQLEVRAIRIYHSEPVQKALERLTKLLESDPHASDVSSAAIRHDAREIAFGEIDSMVNDDARTPFLYWYYKPEHKILGIQVPGAKYAMSNPDTVFRYAPIDPHGRYVISGQFPPQHRSYLSFHLSGGTRGDEASTRELSVLFDHDLTLAPDGRFTVTMDARPGTEAGNNHIQLSPDANRLTVRDTLADWGVETPVAMTIRREDKASAADQSDSELANAAALAIDRSGPAILGFRDKFFLAKAPNTLPTPASHPSGSWAITLESNFALREDEALVFTLDPIGARYLGVQTADILTGTLGPDQRPSTLNSSQAEPNPDGTITFVLAPRDPGARNWVDTGGVAKGLIMIRWQGLPKSPPDLSRAVRKVAVVRDTDLPQIIAANQLERVESRRHAKVIAGRRIYLRRYSGW